MFCQKSCLSLIVLVIIGCLAPCGGSSTAKAISTSGSGPATYPMTRSEFFGRIDSRLVASCDVSREEYNLDRDKCLQLITQRTASCAKSVSVASTIEDKTQFKTYGTAYLDCAKPHFFCKGIEVKTLGAAISNCR